MIKKFRAFHEHHGMCDSKKMKGMGISICFDGGTVFRGENSGLGFSIMQFTGLKDQYGVEIFEGDIVSCKMKHEGGCLPHIGELVYMDEFAAFATKNHAGKTLIHNHALNTFKILGNIHENPELLE